MFIRFFLVFIIFNLFIDFSFSEECCLERVVDNSSFAFKKIKTRCGSPNRYYSGDIRL